MLELSDKINLDSTIVRDDTIISDDAKIKNPADQYNFAWHHKGYKNEVTWKEGLKAGLIEVCGIFSVGFIEYSGIACMLLGSWGLIITLILYYYLSDSSSFIKTNIWYICGFLIILAIIGVAFSSSANYYKLTKCERCGRDYSYKEDSDPDVDEVTTKDDIRIITTTRKYKCSNCGHVKTVKENTTIKPSYPIYGEQP
jgi:uncharacterized membrane protein